MSIHVPFEANDLVAVFGGDVCKKEKIADQVTICRVLAVGELDLLVEEASERFSRLGTYVVPMSLCKKLEINPACLDTSTALVPQIGDLVLSYTRESYKKKEPEQITGILFKITYKLGKPYTCTLISGEEMKEVSANDLIVLQQKA